MTMKKNQYKQNVRFKLHHQAGFSLLELMISMVVGIFLLAGLVTNFISTKDLDLKRNAISEMDANAQVVLNVMRQTISHAGYTSIESLRLNKPFYTDADGNLDNPSCGNGIFRDPVNQTPTLDHTTRDDDRADRLTVVSLADNPCNEGLASCPDSSDVNPNAYIYYDCTGGGMTRTARVVSCSTDPVVGMIDPTQAKIYSTFSLVQDTRILSCDGSRGGSQPLAENVEAMQFLYGVKQINGSTVYRRANEIEAEDDWRLVNSVQVALLMRSSHQYVLKQNSDKASYTLLDMSIDIASNDLRRMFRVYTTTINLENKNKGALL